MILWVCWMYVTIREQLGCLKLWIACVSFLMISLHVARIIPPHSSRSFILHRPFCRTSSFYHSFIHDSIWTWYFHLPLIHLSVPLKYIFSSAIVLMCFWVSQGALIIITCSILHPLLCAYKKPVALGKQTLSFTTDQACWVCCMYVTELEIVVPEYCFS